jgi:hypothetical protein
MPSDSDTVEKIRAMAEHFTKMVRGSNRGHYIAAERAEVRGRVIGITSAILGAVVGTSIFATIQSSPSVGWRISAGLLATGAAVLAAMYTFLDYATRAASHRTADAAYGRLLREFDGFFLELSASKDVPQLMGNLTKLRHRMDELGQNSPLIPSPSFSAGQREIEKRFRRSMAEWQRNTSDVCGTSSGQHLIRRLCCACRRPGFMPCDLAAWYSLVRVVSLCFAVL